MSSTRHAESGTPFRQERFSSDPAFATGLMANLVAKRAGVLENPANREMVWALQDRSHHGGLSALANELRERYRPDIATEAMLRFGIAAGRMYNAAHVEEIRRQIPRGDVRSVKFLTRGEYSEIEELDIQIAGRGLDLGRDNDQRAADAVAASQARPKSLPAQMFKEVCESAAAARLADHLRDLCLDPSTDPGTGPWYFPTLPAVLAEVFQKQAGEVLAGMADTTVARMVREGFDFAWEEKRMAFRLGSARIGKSHAAKSLCRAYPGRGRYFEVPPGTDETSFLSEMARAIGVSSPSKLKVHDLKPRIVSALSGGDLLLIVDEAQRAWPESNYRESQPKRINFLMWLRNQGVPLLLLSTHQFFNSQARVEEDTGWNSAQFVGRVDDFAALPETLSDDDIAAVVNVRLPKVDQRTVDLLVAYTKSTLRYLGGLDSVICNADRLARKQGRAATFADFRAIVQASALPSDTALGQVLADAESRGRKSGASPARESRGRRGVVARSVSAPQENFPARSIQPSPTQSEPGAVPVEKARNRLAGLQTV